MARVAAIDCGTNSIRLLVADVDLDATLDKRISGRNDVFADRRTDLY